MSEAITKDNKDKRSNYWDSYYSNNQILFPSQFAVFFCDYLKPKQNIVEFGSGCGRDSIFFSRQEFNVCAFDGSEHAINTCNDVFIGHPELKFNLLKIPPSINEEQVTGNISLIQNIVKPEIPTAVYARFFLHAITEEEENSFLSIVNKVISKDSFIALEFRTVKDSLQAKVTKDHYRRYIDPVKFIEKLNKYSLQVEYYTEGFGYAKYKKDDAHIARFILKHIDA